MEGRCIIRCPDCEKMVSYDDETDIEVDDVSVQDDEITAEVTITRKCADCSAELAQAAITASAYIEHECPNNPDAAKEMEFEITGQDDPEPQDRYQTTSAKGKPIKPRYQKHFIGFELAVKVKCGLCNESDIEVLVSGEEQASAFESMV